MTTVHYIAPVETSCNRTEWNTCRVSPDAIISPHAGRRPYLVRVDQRWDDAESDIVEGDILVVDDRQAPKAGSVCVFSDGDTLNAHRIREHKGDLLPVSRKEGFQLTYCGTVTRLIRYYV